MKHYNSIFVIGVIILSCFHLSCSKDKHKEITGLPNLLDENLSNNYQSTIQFNYCSYSSDVEAYVSVWVKDTGEMVVPELTVNNNIYTHDDLNIIGGGFWYSYPISPGELEPETTIDYILKVGTYTYYGEVKMPSEVEVDYPIFNPNIDYSLQWNLDKNPSTQIIHYEIRFNDADQKLNLREQVESTLRILTIPKQQFVNADYLITSIQAINIANSTSSFMALSCTENQKYTDFDKKHKKQFQKQHNKTLLKRLIMNLENYHNL